MQTRKKTGTRELGRCARMQQRNPYIVDSKKKLGFFPPEWRRKSLYAGRNRVYKSPLFLRDEIVKLSTPQTPRSKEIFRVTVKKKKVKLKICQVLREVSYHLTGKYHKSMNINKLEGGKMSKINLTGSYLILPDST